ncbi:MAG: hypothetical protein D3924_00750 [Candidatus Electrothrix sp. AR4]|nr:hypothetical protein [Candidatus Electrothrix sp. AR4]
MFFALASLTIPPILLLAAKAAPEDKRMATVAIAIDFFIFFSIDNYLMDYDQRHAWKKIKVAMPISCSISGGVVERQPPFFYDSTSFMP